MYVGSSYIDRVWYEEKITLSYFLCYVRKSGFWFSNNCILVFKNATNAGDILHILSKIEDLIKILPKKKLFGQFWWFL